jgi:hypothetical protein
MPKSKDPRKPFHVLLSADEMDMLTSLTSMSGESGGAVLRAALRARFSHQCMNCPTCASGTPCYVPHMHAHTQTATPGIPYGSSHNAIS